MRFFLAVAAGFIVLACAVVTCFFFLPMGVAGPLALAYCALALIAGIAFVAWVFATGGPG